MAIIESMRNFVLILMIALVPMRLWAADGMAIRMAQGELAVAEMSVTASMPEDCPMMADARHADDSQDSSTSSEARCLSCHLCAATACVADRAVEPGPAPTGPPSFDAGRYVSAALAPALKPPIS